MQLSAHDIVRPFFLCVYQKFESRCVTVFEAVEAEHIPQFPDGLVPVLLLLTGDVETYPVILESCSPFECAVRLLGNFLELRLGSNEGCVFVPLVLFKSEAGLEKRDDSVVEHRPHLSRRSRE